jgi:hypothetical protein
VTPVAAYRRALDELTRQLGDVLHALGELDADEAFRAVAELEDLCADVLERAEAIEAHLPFPRQRVDVPTGRYL